MNLKNELEALARYALALAALAAVILTLSALLLGFSAMVKFLHPLLYSLAGASICVFTLIVLPLSFFKKIRPSLAAASLILAIFCNLSIWLYSFSVIVGYLGWLAVLFFFLFRFICPIAGIGLLINGQWQAGLFILAGMVIAKGISSYGLWLAQPPENKRYRQAEVIDIESEEVDE